MARLCAVLLLLAGCSSDPAELRVAGSYVTAVKLDQSSCDGLVIRDNTTSVAQAPGSTRVTLTHAGNSYDGAIDKNGMFATSPKAVGSATELHTLTIAGQFFKLGFTATVSAQVTREGMDACAYTVKWVGTRTSGENVIPGG